MKKSKSRASYLALAIGIVATGISSFTCMATPPSNQALSKLKEADQADRNPGSNKIDWSIVASQYYKYCYYSTDGIDPNILYIQNTLPMADPLPGERRGQGRKRGTGAAWSL
jgi:hypothetical protein